MKQARAMRNRVTAWLMMVLMIVGLIQANPVNVLADEIGGDSPQGESRALDAYLRKDACSIVIGDTQVAPDTAEPVKVAYNDTVQIHLKWAFTDNAFPKTSADRLTYELPEGLSLSGTQGPIVMDDTIRVGHYELDGRTITIVYDDEENAQTFLARDARESELTVTAHMDKKITNDGKGGKSEFEFQGIGTVTIDMERDNSGDGVQIEKTGGAVSGSGNARTSTFTLKITAKGRQTNVVVTDEMEKHLSLDGDVHFYTDAACTQEYSGAVTEKEKSAHGFSYTIAQMEDGQVLYAAYTVKLDKRIFAFDRYDTWHAQAKNVAKVSSDSQKWESTAEKSVEYQMRTWATKTHVYNESEKNITWTITLNPGAEFDISGSLIWDTLGDTMDYKKGTFSCTPAVDGLTWESFSSGKFVMPNGSNQEYKITYQTTVGKTSAVSAVHKSNTVHINPWGDTRDISCEDGFDIGKGHDYISKSCLTPSGTSEDVLWQITVHVPQGGIENLVVEDVLPEEFVYGENAADSFQVTAGNNLYTGTAVVTTGENGPKITFGQVQQGDLTFTLRTKLTKVPEQTKTYHNRAICKNADKTLGEAGADYTYIVEGKQQYLSKVAYINHGSKRSDSGSQTMDWQLQIETLPEDTKEAYITDLLPENCRLQKDSLRVYTAKDWNKEETELAEDIRVQESDGKVLFTLTGKALDYAKQAGSRLTLCYCTAFVDFEEAAKASKQYVNRAFLTVNGTARDTVKADQWKKADTKEILDKKGYYSKKTLPWVVYTITVNQKAQDLDPASDVLMLTDEMGSALDYCMGSMKMQIGDGEAKKLDGDQIHYDATSHTLLITVPDSQKIVLTYKALPNLAVGTALDEHNAANRCTLKGVGKQGISDQYTLQGTVLKSDAVAAAKGVNVQIYKHETGDEQKGLSGASFVCSEVSYADGRVTGVVKTGDEVQTNRAGRASITKLQRNRLYRLTETAAQEGYVLDSTPKFFIFRESGLLHQNVDYPLSITEDGKTYPVKVLAVNQASVSYNLANEKEAPGNLLITKTIQGAVTREEAESALVFTVTNNDTGAVDTYHLSDFTYDETSRTYSKKLSCVAGGYTVTESVTDIEGYTLTSVTYKKGNGTYAEGNSADITIGRAATTTVDFCDNYTKKEEKPSYGKLVITKTIAGEVTEEEAEGTLSFEVENFATGETKLYSLKSEEFRYDAAAKKWKLELDATEGGYRVKEIASDITGHPLASVSYCVDGEQSQRGATSVVHVQKDQTTVVAYKNDYATNQTSVSISKVDAADTSHEIAGAQLTVTEGKADDPGKTMDSWTSEEGKIHNVTLAVGRWYTLSELVAPDGYYEAESISFYVDQDGTVRGSNQSDAVAGNRIIMKDEKKAPDQGTILLTKTIKGAVSREEAEGALVFLVQRDGFAESQQYTLSTFTYHADTKTWTKELPAVTGGYTVTEQVKQPVTGYVLAEVTYRVDKKSESAGDTAAFEVTKDHTTEVSFTNRYETKNYEVEISKVDAAGGQELAGAKLEIIDTDNQAKIASWISGSDGTNADGTCKSHTVTLPAGNYLLKEILAPDGYDLAESINFTVGVDGTVAGFEKNRVVMKDQKTPEKPSQPDTPVIPSDGGSEYGIEISKIDATSGSELAGAQLQIISNATGQVVASWVSGCDGYLENGTVKTHTVKLKEGSYTLTEILAPDGYAKAESITFTVNAQGQVDGGKVVMKDERQAVPTQPDQTPDTKTGDSPKPGVPAVKPETPQTVPVTSKDGDTGTQTQKHTDDAIVKESDVTEDLEGKDDVPKTGVWMAVAGIWKAVFALFAGIAAVTELLTRARKRKNRS